MTAGSHQKRKKGSPSHFEKAEKNVILDHTCISLGPRIIGCDEVETIEFKSVGGAFAPGLCMYTQAV